MVPRASAAASFLFRFPDPGGEEAGGYTLMKELSGNQIERIRPGMPVVRR
jgi:hypothetical protein